VARKNNPPSGGDFVAIESSSVVTEDSGETEVSDLELSSATDEKISRLQITVHDVIVMTECYALQQHQHVTLYLHPVETIYYY